MMLEDLTARRGLNTPAARLALVLLIGLLAAVLSTRMALDQPRLAPTAAGRLVGGMRVEALDLTADPGEITRYPELRRFYQRQDQIWARTAATTPKRALGDLPVAFWVQLVVGAGALLISGWVWSLRPRDLASGLFALSGLSTLAFTLSAAVYSTRALALPSGPFQALALANMLGATLFGAAMIGLFLVYPRRLSFWKPLLLLSFVVFMAWTAFAGLRWLPDGRFGGNFITLVEMALIVAAIVAQHRATRRHPEARAALTWLGMSVILGAGGFILLSAAPAALGLELPIAQAYAFPFFLLIYIGLAAGLRRYRLFEVGEWGLRVAFYALGAAMVLALDGVLLATLGLDRAPAFSLAILATALVYLPFRDQLWRLVTRRRPMETHDALAAALDVAFAVSPGERASRWTALLQRTFDPLLIESKSEPVSAPRLGSDGVSLSLPAAAGAAPLRLSHPHAGRALFRPADLKLAVQLVAVVERAERGREAYDRGVKEERRRVAQDLHDDVGARLLTGLHTADAAFKPTLQAAISDIRAIVSGISGERASLEVLLGDMRYEAVRRLESAGIGLDWPLIETPDGLSFDYRQHKALTSAVREAVSNVVRHSGATRLEVRTTLSADAFSVSLNDDGQGLPAEALAGEARGFGLKSLKRRMTDIGGSLVIDSGPSGASVTLTLPLRMPESAPN